MSKGIFFFLLILFSGNTFATLLKATASGSFSANDFDIFDPGTFCCSSEFTDVNFEFTTTINLDSFQISEFSDGKHFLHYDYDSTLMINGVETPKSLVLPDPTETGIAFAHIIAPERLTGGIPSPYSTIQLNAGLTFKEENRFLITENLYLREMTLFTNIFDVNPIIGDADNLQRFLTALTQNTLPKDNFGHFVLGDNNNPDDNVVAFASYNGQIDYKLVTQRVSEPATLSILGIGALFVVMRRRRQ